MAKIATEHSLEKLDHILAAAQLRFGHYGLSKTTMNDIADDIGMSKASLYYYFKDKEHIFKAVAEKEQNYFISEMDKIIQSTRQPEALLREYVRLRMDLLKDLLTLAKFNVGSFQDVKPLMTPLLLEFRKKEMNLVSRILKSGEKQNIFSVPGISKYAAFFLDTLRGIRQGIIAGYGDKETMEISKGKYRKIQEQTSLFTELFIKGIRIQ